MAQKVGHFHLSPGNRSIPHMTSVCETPRLIPVSNLKAEFMKSTCLHLFLIVLSLCIGDLVAGNPLARRIPDTDITCLIMAKTTSVEGRDHIDIRIPAWKQEIRTEEYQVEVPVVATETREVEKDGRTVVEEVQITKIVTETRTREVANYLPKDPISGIIPLEAIKAWNLKGKELSAKELKASLSKSNQLLCLTTEPKPGTPPLDPFYAGSFRPDILIVYSQTIEELLESSIEYTTFAQEGDDTAPLPAPTATVP